MFEVPLNAEALAVLFELAAKSGVSPEEFARRAILDRMEDAEDNPAAAERLRTSDGVTVALDQVMARLQAKAVASGALEPTDQAFVDAVSDWSER